MRPGARRCLAVLGVLASLAGAGVHATVTQAYPFRISISRSPVTRPLAADFLGLALEYNTIPKWVGTGSGRVNPALVALIRNLDPSGRPMLRIGGQSADRAWWPVPGMSKPRGVTYDLGTAWTTAARALARATDAKLLLGVNLEANRTRIDRVEATHLLRGIGRRYIAALQIGNEPDLYPAIPWYRLVGGRPAPWYSHAGTLVFSRRFSYSPADFDAEFARTLRVLPQLPIAGPETSNPPWLSAFRRFVRPGSRVRILTSHAYPLSQCITDPSSPGYPSVPHLLSLAASRQMLGADLPYVSLAHADGLTYRVDELGSTSCNGRAGVSNSAASALWLMDALFSIARDQIDGVNLHTYPNSVNGLFDFRRSHGRWKAAVHPLYYGALMFAKAAPSGSRLLATHSSSQDRLRAWATLGRDHRVRVLLINDSLRSSSQTLLRPPRGFGSRAATIERLHTPSAYATNGITLGGHGFSRRSSSGTLPPPHLQISKPSRGRYRVTVPPSSAALVTLAPN